MSRCKIKCYHFFIKTGVDKKGHRIENEKKKIKGGQNGEKTIEQTGNSKVFITWSFYSG